MTAAGRNPVPAILEQLLLGQLPPDEVERLCVEYADDDQLAAIAEQLGSADQLLDTLRAQATWPHQPPDPRIERFIGRLLQVVPPLTATADKSPTASADGASSPVAAGRQPERLDHFRIIGVLGEGGMGTVYEAEDTRLGRRVAIKTMRRELATHPAARGRFLREARSAAAIEHENIVPIYHVGEADDVPYLAMPLLKGEGLDRRLRRAGAMGLPVVEVLDIGRGIAVGLAAAHTQGLIHRDIKPGNVWLEDRGPARPPRVKLLDFGLARTAEEDARLTKDGVIVGTPAYMAPEQARGHAVDYRADLFSLGAVLYHLATGRRPFDGPDTLAILASLAADRPVPVNEANPEVPAPLADLISRLLAKDPAARPETAAEVARVLEALAQIPAKLVMAAPAEPTPSRVRPRWRGPQWAPVATGLAILAVAAVLVAQIIIIRDKTGKEVGRVEVPPGGSFEVKPSVDEPKPGPPAAPSVPLPAKIEPSRLMPPVPSRPPPVVTAPRLPTGNDPPARDAFPGKLIFHDTFSDPKVCTLYRGVRGEVEHAVENGKYVLEFPAGKPGFGMLENVRSQAPNCGFTIRQRATNATAFIAFRNLGTNSRTSWLEFQLTPGGRWSVLHSEAVFRNGKWDRLQRVIAQGEGPNPALAAGQWVNVTGFAVGDDYAIWLNGQLVVRGTDDTAYTGPSTHDAAVQIGGFVGAAGLARVEFDYVAVWDVSTTAPPPSEITRLLTEAQAANDRAEYQRAITLCTEVLRWEPKHQTARYVRGRGYLGISEFDAAIADLTEVLNHDPEHRLARDARSFAYLNTKRFDECIADCDKLLSLEPAGRFAVIALNNRGGAWAFKGRFDRAYADFDTSSRLDPNDAIPPIWKGIVLKRMGEESRGQTEIEKGLKLAPHLKSYGFNRLDHVVPQPPPLTEWLQGREVLTVAQDGRGQFRTIGAALDALKPGQVIQILDRGPYRELFGKRTVPADTGLISEVGTRIEIPRWTDIGPDESVPMTATRRRTYAGGQLLCPGGFRLFGLEVVSPEVPNDATIAWTFLMSGGQALVVEGCRFSHTPRFGLGPPPRDVATPYWFGGLSVLGGEGATRARITIRDNHVDGRLEIGGHSTAAVSAVVEQNRILGWQNEGVILPRRGTQVIVRHNVIHAYVVGVLVPPWNGPDAEVAAADYRLVNNTIDVVYAPVFLEPRSGNAKTFPGRLRVANNLMISQTGAGVHAAGDDWKSSRDRWTIDHNGYLAEPGSWRGHPPRLLGPTDCLLKRTEFTTDPREPGYLRVPTTGPLAMGGAGGDLPTFIGAFPPGPAPKDGDWFTRLHSRTEWPK